MLKTDQLKFIFNEIESELQTGMPIYEDQEQPLHNSEQALEILKCLRSFSEDWIHFANDQGHTLSLYALEKITGDASYFTHDQILHIVLDQIYLFPLKDDYLFYVDQKFSAEMLLQYPLHFKNELELIKKNHDETTQSLENHFNPEMSFSELLCRCNDCVGIYRTKARNALLEKAYGEVDRVIERLETVTLTKSIDQVSHEVFRLRKFLERIQSGSRYKLKRASQKRLERDIKDYYNQALDSNSVLAKTYREKLITKFNSWLLDWELAIELLAPEDYQRFFEQIQRGIWKPEKSLQKEFKRFTQSILAFKRKDISSTILNEYLGQFWMHSEARKIRRKFIYHMGPTNSGKTYHAIQALCEAPKGCYLAPLRLLAGELFDTMNNKGVKTNLLTGEEVLEIEGATHYSSTIEMAKLNERFDCCVIDEIQMMTDPQRGWAWTRAMVNLNSDEVHLCGDGSVLELVKQVLDLTEDDLEVRNYERKTELKVMNHVVTLAELEKNDALIVFSRRNALKYKSDLERLGHRVSIVYGRLSPEVRREQARKFDEGETDIIVSTDAIAMGMNLPVRRIIFSTLSKFINSKECPITHSEIKQIAGRAGRYQRFPTGYVTTLKRVEGGLRNIQEALYIELDQQKMAMVGPDLDIFRQVNTALEEHQLPSLKLSEFLRLFFTMTFVNPFYCVELKEMIDVAEMVEAANDELDALSDAEIFGFACAPVNLGVTEHVQYFTWIVNNYVNSIPIQNEKIDASSNDIDYLETAIKCVELYQWLSRHFHNKNFEYNLDDLLQNKSEAVDKLNSLLSEKIKRSCSSCGVYLPDQFEYNICEGCFSNRRRDYRRLRPKKENLSGVGRDRKKKFSSRRKRKK